MDNNILISMGDMLKLIWLKTRRPFQKSLFCFVKQKPHQKNTVEVDHSLCWLLTNP